jgi:general secretion pathway protein B
MSYILDALKKADSERERGAVPGLYAQPVPLARPVDTPGKPLILTALIACALILIAALAWRWLSPAPAPPVAMMATAPVAATPAPPATGPAMQPPAPPVAPVAPVAPQVMDKAPKGEPLPTGTANQPTMKMAPAAITRAESAGKKPADEVRPAPAAKPDVKPVAKPATPVTPPAVPATSAPRVAGLPELPQDARLALPKLVVSGSTYSDNPAYRMVIINGQVFREGDKLANDLNLEQIRPKAAVLNYKGQLYQLGY